MIVKVRADKINPSLAKNITSIHDSIPGLNLITDLDPIFAGGYSMALLFAPREKNNIGKISSDYFSDFDVYFDTEAKANEAIARLKDKTSLDIYETENATTIMVDQLGNQNTPTPFQIVKKIHGRANDIISTFDFINCAVAFTPKQESFYMHNKAPKFHREKRLETLNPWMIRQCLEQNVETEDLINQNIIIQLSRFQKYALRWEYSLSDKSFDTLISVYEKYPNIKTKTNIPYTTVGGPYSGCSYIAYRNQNIWAALARLFVCHEKWNSYQDKAGVISSCLGLADIPRDPILTEVPF